jgi:hypothetical protein
LIGFCDEILPRKDHLWTFLDVEGIEPTNNAAARALRSAVIKRNAYEYLIGVMKAKFAGETALLLLPLIEDHAAAA